MIHVDRPDPPDVLLKRAPGAAAHTADFFEGRGDIAKQQVKYHSYDFDGSVWLDTSPALQEVFHGKCAFCESLLVTLEAVNVGHFRPRRDAMDLDGTTSGNHYYWLAYDWENLYAICADCDRNKRTMFPVVAGKRAETGATGAMLEKQERRLIIDPCFDHPEEHLLFGDEGHVASITPVDPAQAMTEQDRATITIDVFGLNRPDMVKRRRAAAAETKAALDLVREQAQGDRGRLELAIAPLVSAEREFAMVRRQVAARWLQRMDESASLDASQLAQKGVEQQLLKPASRKRAFKRQERHEATQDAASIQDEASYARTSRITRVRLENFRGVTEVEFEVPTTGWKMLIGENGTGKSSILQAIAIALMGREQANELRRSGDLDPKKLVRRGRDLARIVVHQGASVEPIEVTITSRGFKFPRGRTGQKAVLLGFGSARWLPRRGGLRTETDEWIRVRNLLNPFVPLGDADRWLRSLDPRTTEFRTAVSVIRALLRLPDTTKLRVLNSELRVQEGLQRERRWLTLDQLSDGYQSALAMATGIMGPLFSKWDVMREAEGVVLVDELDAHLHPRWKMRIVNDLRTAFPKVQFIASTHEPLCLRGLLEREILALRRDEHGRLIYTDDLPSPVGLRVDQLLTSRFFGLHSTFDPDTERDLERYYTLLAQPTRDAEETMELETLRQRVGSAGMLGDTPRDQVIYAVIDKFVAQELREPDEATLMQRREATEAHVAEIWHESVSGTELEKVIASVLREDSR